MTLTAGGLTVLSRWLAGGVNNGVVIQLYSGTSSDTLAFDSKEGTTPPVLNVTYCLPTSTTTYTLTANNDGNGSVTLAPTGGTYTSGTTVTLTPVPNSGYLFDSWTGADSGDVINTGGVYTIVMDSDKTVQANFVTAYTLTVTKSGDGLGHGDQHAGRHRLRNNLFLCFCRRHQRHLERNRRDRLDFQRLRRRLLRHHLYGHNER